MIWLAVIGFPLFLSCLLGHPGTRGLAAGPGLWIAPLPALGFALAGVGADPGIFPALFLETRLDFGPYGRFFLLLASLLWAAAGLFRWSSQRHHHEHGRYRFAFFFLVTLSGNLGVCVAQDLASFYVFFALMSFAAYGLIIHDQTPKARHAGRIYLIMTVFGEVLLASAFFYAGVIGDSLLFEVVVHALEGPGTGQHRVPLVFGLALIGFGIKAGVVGLHFWLPLAHPAAPTAASAVLSGVMIKIGLLGWLQLFSWSTVLVPWGLGMAWLGLLGAFYAAAVGFVRREPKTILAYSSVSQMGLMTMAVGFALAADPEAGNSLETASLFQGLLLFVLVHGLAKGALFLGVGVAMAVPRGTALAQIVLIGLAAAGLVLAGAPFTGGALVKDVLKVGAEQLPEIWSGFFIVLLPLTAVGTTLLLAMFFWSTCHHMHPVTDFRQMAAKKPGVGMLLAWGGLLVILLSVKPLAFALFPESIGMIRDHGANSGQSAGDGLWPIAIGLIVAWLLLRLRPAAGETKSLDEIFLDGLERLIHRLHVWWRDSPYCDPACGTINLVAWSDRILQSRWMQTVPDRIERRLLYWHSVGVLFVIFLLFFLAITWLGR